MKALMIEANRTVADAMRSLLAKTRIEVEAVTEEAFITMLEQPGGIAGVAAILVGNVGDPKGLIADIRSKNLNNPLISILDQRNGQMIATMLQAGADDVVAQPVGPQEIHARIGAIARRRSGNTANFVIIDGLKVFLDGRDPEFDGKPVRLSQRELAIFTKLAQHHGQVVDKDRIYQSVYAMEDEPPFEKVIDVYICKIRKKLTQVTGTNLIETVYGRGYRLADSSDRPEAVGTAGQTGYGVGIQEARAAG